MAARKGTILSDEHILKECAHYRPIPMKLAARIIDGNSVVAKESPFTNKKLKYQRQMSRPEHFDAYANSLSRNLGNDPEFRGRLHGAYTADVAQHHTATPAPAPATPSGSTLNPQAPAFVPQTSFGVVSPSYYSSAPSQTQGTPGQSAYAPYIPFIPLQFPVTPPDPDFNNRVNRSGLSVDNSEYYTPRRRTYAEVVSSPASV